MADSFKSTLSDFISDIAYGDSVRHLAKKGMTINQIANSLTYPAKIADIQSIVWKYYISSGIIRLEKPVDDCAQITQTKYVIDHGSYGRSSYRKVEEVVPGAPRKYIPCEFGKLLYKDKDAFIKSLEHLSKDDRDYILGLPWPLETVYHINDERMQRIMSP